MAGETFVDGIEEGARTEHPTAGALCRRPSHVSCESDCSSPTSWEFCEVLHVPSDDIVNTEKPAFALSMQRVLTGAGSPGGCSPVHHLNTFMGSPPLEQRSSPMNSPKADLRGADGSRNSTGSSVSHRSQDSGFSDSGETRVSRRPRNSATTLTVNNTHSHNGVSKERLLPIGHYGSCSPTAPNSFSIPPNFNGEIFNHVHNTHISCVSPISRVLSPDGCPSRLGHSHHHHFHEYQPVGRDHAFNSLLPSAQQRPAHEFSPLTFEDRPHCDLLGTPTSCSTPKFGSGISPKNGRSPVVQKIDNFESLNKNKKTLDTNNNSKGINNVNSATNVTMTCVQPLHHHNSNTCPSTHLGRSKEHNSDNNVAYIHSPSIHSHSADDPIKRRSTHFPHLSGATSDVVQLQRHSSNPPKWESLSNSLGGASLADDERMRLNDLSFHNESPSKIFSKSHSRWPSLPKGYKRLPAKSPDSSAASAGNLMETKDELKVVRSHQDNDAMQKWLHDLRQETENECFHTLQNKSIAEEQSTCRRQTNPSTLTPHPSSTCATIHAVAASLHSIRAIEKMANVISAEFATICKYLEVGMLLEVSYSVESLVENIKKFIRHFQESTDFVKLVKLESCLGASCEELSSAGRRLAIRQTDLLSNGDNDDVDMEIIGPSSPQQVDVEKDYEGVVREIVVGIVSLGNLFSQTVDMRLTSNLSSIVATIHAGGIPTKVALRLFATVLADGGMHLCHLACDIDAVRAFLLALHHTHDQHQKILALRCLATILCVPEAVNHFDKAGGFEIVGDLLSDPLYGISVKVEAVSVLTQATDPWLDLESTLRNLSLHLEKIVFSLTNLISHVRLEEDSFLLVVAAISNLTFLEAASLDMLRRCSTVTFILQAVTFKTDFSIFVLDHVATILANMAGTEACRSEIANFPGIITLIKFLEQRPSPGESAPEITACERLQQKSTIAISRLANEDGVAQMVLRMGGIQRLVQLSRNEKERNYSDGVLIACLATLRKLVAICGYDIVQQLNADDLIHPRLLDSFLLYSSRQESYV